MFSAFNIKIYRYLNCLLIYGTKITKIAFIRVHFSINLFEIVLNKYGIFVLL